MADLPKVGDVNQPRTIVLLHAHPDDEAIFTSATTRWYREQGHRVVLITATNGRLGYDPQGRPGPVAGHDSSATVTARLGELTTSCRLLDISEFHFLGYDDSGMQGWPENTEPQSFVSQDLTGVAEEIAAICRAVAADVIITYDEFGYYGHPDHIKCNQAARAAVALVPSVSRLAYVVTPKSLFRTFVPVAEARGAVFPAWIKVKSLGWSDEDVNVDLDLSAYAAIKQDSIRAHATQIDNADIMNMDPEFFRLLFGHEFYVDAWRRDGLEVATTDLLEGIA